MCTRMLMPNSWPIGNDQDNASRNTTSMLRPRGRVHPIVYHRSRVFAIIVPAPLAASHEQCAAPLLRRKRLRLLRGGAGDGFDGDRGQGGAVVEVDHRHVVVSV